MDTTSATTEAIEQQLLEDESEIARARARQMQALRELDRRQVALRDGHRSLQEWVAGRIDLAPETARELVNTARRLHHLPDINQAVAAGEIGFDRAAAISRLANHDHALELLAETAGRDIESIRVLAAKRRRSPRRA